MNSLLGVSAYVGVRGLGFRGVVGFRAEGFWNSRVQDSLELWSSGSCALGCRFRVLGLGV